MFYAGPALASVKTQRILRFRIIKMLCHQASLLSEHFYYAKPKNRRFQESCLKTISLQSGHRPSIHPFCSPFASIRHCSRASQISYDKYFSKRPPATLCLHSAGIGVKSLFVHIQDNGISLMHFASQNHSGGKCLYVLLEITL